MVTACAATPQLATWRCEHVIGNLDGVASWQSGDDASATTQCISTCALCGSLSIIGVGVSTSLIQLLRATQQLAGGDLPSAWLTRKLAPRCRRRPGVRTGTAGQWHTSTKRTAAANTAQSQTKAETASGRCCCCCCFCTVCDNLAGVTSTQ